MFITLSKKQSILFFLIIFFLLFASIFYIIRYTTNVLASSNTNWGLSFKEENKAPVGNATKDFLKKYNAYYIGDEVDKTIYITFDAGYENGNTIKILESLKKHNVKATFFVVGSFISQNPEIIKQIIADGHIIGNHTMTHPNMSKMETLEDFKNEVLSVEKIYKELIGTDMQKLYRPPQGIYNEKNLQMAQELGYKTVFWSLAYVDWYQDRQPTKEEAFSKLLTRIHPGTILLLHSTSKTNADILNELLSKFEEMGYTFKALDDI